MYNRQWDWNSNNLPTTESPWLDRATDEVYQTFKEELTLRFSYYSIKETMLPNSSYEGSITLLQKPDKEAHSPTHTHKHKGFVYINKIEQWNL
jgi:hypothetical protein